jgi:hypothetical protein
MRSVMKNKIVWLLLPLILFGCSKKASIPFAVTIVETVEAKEVNDITNQAKDLFQAKDYDGLDALARKLRNSKECYASGTWKICFVYDSVDLSEEASDTEWTAHLAALQDWINARPDSITARVAMAKNLVSYAWKARNDDWADKVTEEGWQLFNQRLNQAVKVLNEARPLNEKCPYWWFVLLTTDLGLSPERSQYDVTFDEATRAWPNYMYYYNDRAYYLLPRWHGTEGEWESDLEKSADRIGGEEGDLLYARVVWYMHQTHFYKNIFTECKLSWPRVDKGFQVIEKQFPNSLAAKSERAYLAVLACDVQDVRKYIDQLEGRVDLVIWKSQDTFLYAADWAYKYGN